ncbi:MAG: VCBS repeat-containing protein [Deltaproteobacteria bacterium]|nr:VCBS repeat-containing protein [Deltaproteobacteria bacterium]
MRSPLSSLTLLCLVVAGCGWGGFVTLAPNSPVNGDAGSSNRPPGPDAGCPTVLCGAEGTCCPEGQECVEEACVLACASQVRCGLTCCDAGQVCLARTCATPGAACRDSFDCEEADFCEPTLGKCLPQPEGASGCEWRSPTDVYSPTLEWSWTSSTIQPGSVQVINMPLVIDLDADRIPDVVIVTSSEVSLQNEPAYLRALDGKSGLEKWPATADVYKAENQLNLRATPAAGDLDGDGRIEIVALSRAGGLIAFRDDGSLLWRSTLASGAAYGNLYGACAVVLADLDGDGKAEIVVSGVVFDSLGRVVSGAGREFAGNNGAGNGTLSIVADVDADGAQEVVTGKAAWRRDGSVLWNCESAGACGVTALSDGYPTLADLDADGDPELVVVSVGSVRVQRARTGQRLAQLKMPDMGYGGPPVIADFDGDGRPEIAVAAGKVYSVYRYTSQPSPLLTMVWSRTQDLSSSVTGSSAFDFEGDGAAEVLHNDGCYLRVYSGEDGRKLLELPSTMGPNHEYPVPVDVDGDESTEIVVVASDRSHSGRVVCSSYSTDEHPLYGVFVYGDSQNRWARTRKVWNQHAYHVTNIGSDGRVPPLEAPSWSSEGPNTYRVSTQGSGAFNAPNLQLDLEVSTAACPDMLILRARVKNAGALGARAGVSVTFFLGTSASGTQVGSGRTSAPILPGGAEVVEQRFDPAGRAGPFSFHAVVNADPPAGVHECRDDDNAATVGNASCP